MIFHGISKLSWQVTEFTPESIHLFIGTYAIHVEFRYSKNLRFWVEEAEVHELPDKVLAFTVFDDDVVSDVRQMAVAKSTTNVLSSCFIDEDIVNWFHRIIYIKGV
jgi:hypothetical protein